ncbi:MAG TPA: chromate transporter [Firmicutes bacterium]|jgi:chromate transporter|nr:chromate transporter [Bacillota bacterium]
MILLKLLFTFAFIGSLAFGGGYVMIPLIDSQVVEKLGWLTSTEFADIVAIAEMTPGPIAINTATYVGFKMAGVLGSVVATTGVVAPSFIIVMILAKLVNRFSKSPYLQWALSGVRPVVVGLIASAAWSFGAKTLVDLKSWILAGAMLLALAKTKINPILLILASFILGILFF